jgi:ribosomal protein L11 methyltransferase
LAIRVAPAQAELVLAELLELAPSGVEEAALADGTVEYAVYGAPGELPSLPDLTAAAGEALVEVRTEEVAEDWADRWRSFHRPVVIDQRLTVRPPWEPAPGSAEVDVVIDPGRAFGTGGHPTTRLCLELLLSLEPVGGLLDLGCGSGVLAIAAAKLGFGPVRALDFDPAAIDATRQNAAANGVELAEVRRFDLRTEALPAARTVVANLTAPLLAKLASRLPAQVETLIVSGLLDREAEKVTAAFAERHVRERRDAGGWAALLLL